MYCTVSEELNDDNDDDDISTKQCNWEAFSDFRNEPRFIAEKAQKS